MNKKKQRTSVAETIMKTMSKQHKSAAAIGAEIKDNFGYKIKPKDISTNLLYLLRRGKIKRTKEDRAYKYHL